MKAFIRLVLFSLIVAGGTAARTQPAADCPCGPDCRCNPCECAQPAMQFAVLHEMQPIVPDDTAARLEALEKRVAELAEAINRLAPAPQEQSPLRGNPGPTVQAVQAAPQRCMTVCGPNGCSVVAVAGFQSGVGTFADDGGGCASGACGAGPQMRPIRRGLFGRYR